MLSQDDINQVMNITYPIGSIYESTSQDHPANFFGGEWELWGIGCVTEGGIPGLIPSGVSKGSTNVTVPIPRHKHTGDLYGYTSHGHDYVAPRGSTVSVAPGSSSLGSIGVSDGQVVSTTTKTQGMPGVRVDIAETGTLGATIDVTQPTITLYRWRRIA